MRARFLISVSAFLFALSAFGQSNIGELRLKVTDPNGLAVKTAVQLVSESNNYRNTLTTDDAGTLIAKRLPFGLYRIKIDEPGFAEISTPVEVRSAIPIQYSIKLGLASVNTSILVQDSATLIDPARVDSSQQIGDETLQTRMSSLPGRSLQDLVNSEPGWLYEGNAVLHPRGSEYQTQFVVDGVPLTDNRSPGFAPEIEADDVDSMNTYTAGIPAEFGRKMGGVIEVNTLKNTKQGFHGQAVLGGGSFNTGDAFARVQNAWKGNTLGASVAGSLTSHYLNPVVPQNYTNNGTTGDFAIKYERDLTQNDHIGAIVRHSLSHFQIPNEQVQQAAGQRQDGDNFETMGIISYQHVFSSNALGALRGMVRDGSSDLFSNPESTPVIAFLHSNFREIYFNGSVSIHRGRHEFKAGVESDAMFLHENFSDIITDPDRFDDGAPGTLAFTGSRPDLEQSAYVQDLIRMGNWTVSAGLRWDHYQILVNQNSVSPRISVARYFPSAGLVLHASYDRIFQTPDSGNILLSSSSQVVSLNPEVFRLPVKPSHGSYFEIGGTKAIFDHLRFDANYYRRYVNNYADDDQLLSTAVSFPIAFNKAIIYGAEAKLEIPKWGRWSGYASYSYMVGNAWLPVTGGLFLGDDANDALTNLNGHFPGSQDQRNTVRVRMRYQAHSRVWLAGSTEYGSGLPFEFTGDEQQALEQYGPTVVDRVNFDRGRVRPSLSVGASVGANLYKTERLSSTLQADVQNINNRLNVIDFGGLFSGNAIAPPRSWALRLQAQF